MIRQGADDTTTYDSLTKTLTSIEQSKFDRLTIDDLAQQAHLSGSHLQRLFKLSTGQSLMDYVRGRKLAHSLEELLYTDFRIIDIANRYGFRHEQSYIRAFRSEFGCTPGEARASKIILRIRERITPEDLRPFERGIMTAPEVVMVPSFYIVGRPHVFLGFDDHSDALKPNRLANAFHREDVSRIPNAVKPEIYIGYSRYLSLENNDVEYMPSIQVNDLSRVPGGLTGISVPSHLCIRFCYVGAHHYNEISMVTARETYRAIDAFFTAQSRYTLNELYFFERLETGTYDGIYCRMEWLIPVKDDIEPQTAISG